MEDDYDDNNDYDKMTVIKIMMMMINSRRI